MIIIYYLSCHGAWLVLGQEEGQAKREEGGKEPVGSPWAVDGLDPPSAHAHQPSRHYFCWAWALGGVNGRSIIRRLRLLADFGDWP